MTQILTLTTPNFVNASLKLKFVDPNTTKAFVLEDIHYTEGIVVPKDFESDGVSIPKPLWWYIPPWGTKASKAALVHDYMLDMYAKGTLPPRWKNRKDIDDEFYTALILLGVDKSTALTVWTAVRTRAIMLGRK